MSWLRGFLFFATVAALIASPSLLPAQTQTQTLDQPTPVSSVFSSDISEKLLITSAVATTWTHDNTSIIELSGPLEIDMDRITLRADRAVIWLTPAPGGLLGEQQADIVLDSNASLDSPDNHLHRMGPRLLVTATVRGNIRVSADQYHSTDDSASAQFQRASAFRASPTDETPPGQNSATANPVSESAPPAEPTTQPITQTQPSPVPAKTSTLGDVDVHFGLAQQLVLADDTVVDALGGGVAITQSRANGDFLELLANRAVLFTTHSAATQKSEAPAASATNMGKGVVGVYLEGDVRINFLPADRSRKSEQRLTADSVYYDLAHDQAILTGVVLHTIDPYTQIPVIIRAQKMHQLAQGEYTTGKVELTTSAFATPSYSVRASRAYIRQDVQTWGEVDNNFVAHNVTPDFWGVPVFYLPVVAGTISNDPFPLRDLSTQNSQRFGSGFTSQWGLFETLGEKRPEDLDVTYRLDDFSRRGFGGGFDGTYQGGLIDEGTRQPWDFLGDFKSYLISDRGIDQLGGDRTDVDPPRELRGNILWEHQHFFPDDWQVQIRAGYVSDPTFLEEYNQSDFDDTLPYDASFYAKRQKDTEALTFLGETDTTPFTTNADRQQEQFDVQRLPEIGYRRIGDAVSDDSMTFFSDNSASRLRFLNSRASLAEQGFGPTLSPGLPSEGFTGTPDKSVYRGDSRQELDWPITAGEFKVVPYLFGRATTYSDSPTDNSQTRFMSGGGFRIATSFWKVDDSAESELFDVHRVRTVIEPEVNLFASGTSLDRSRLFDYDPEIDGVNDIQAGQVALHERWQTMRGGPGGWRSVDFLELNVEGDFFANKPPPGVLNPTQFRSLFFPSEPETSVPRDGVNGDFTWRASDTTSFISSADYNIDAHELATASSGVAVSRDERTTWFLDDSYIEVLHSQVLSGEAMYELTRKYTLQIGQSFNFGDTHDISTNVSLLRKFDTFTLQVSIFHDAVNNQSGFNLNVIPLGLRAPSGGLSGLAKPQ